MATICHKISANKIVWIAQRCTVYASEQRKVSGGSSAFGIRIEQKHRRGFACNVSELNIAIINGTIACIAYAPQCASQIYLVTFCHAEVDDEVKCISN